MITNLLNDATPAQIRKSIFLFASIIVFVACYQLDVALPKEFFVAKNNPKEPMPRHNDRESLT